MHEQEDSANGAAPTEHKDAEDVQGGAAGVYVRVCLCVSMCGGRYCVCLSMHVNVSGHVCVCVCVCAFECVSHSVD